MDDHALNATRVHLEDLALEYQPIVDLCDRRIVAIEALLRWNAEKNRALSAEVFVPLLLRKQAGLEVTRWIVRTAVKQLRSWHLQGFRWLRMCINLSVGELADPRISRLMCRAADGAVPRDKIEVEVCERGALLDTPAALAALDDLRRDGFRIAVDDFGAGAASLRYLLDIPADTVKFDRVFIARTANAKAAAVLVNAAQLAERIGYEVVIEGVETRRQLAFARDHGIRYVQGRYLGAPGSARTLSRRLQIQHTER